jgi:hypothetical protein
VEASDRQKHDHFTLVKKGRQFIIRIGEFVAYQTGYGKACRLGKVTVVSVVDAQVTLHSYGPIVGGLRIVWKPLYLAGPEKRVTFAQTDTPALDVVQAKR